MLVGGPACILRAMFCCISSIDSLMSSHAQVVHLPFGGLDFNCGPPGTLDRRETQVECRSTQRKTTDDFGSLVHATH